MKTTDLFGETEFVAKTEPQYHDVPFYLDLIACTACTCRKEASRVVPGVGPLSARIVFVGRNPGRDEDRQGMPFVGRGGGELNRMLEVLGLDRNKVGILNIVKCHTDGDRPPNKDEISICTQNWLQLELSSFQQCSIVFPLGHDAVKVFLGPDAESPGRREGYCIRIKFQNRILHVIPLNHPGYILRARGKQVQMYNTTLPAVKEYLQKGAWSAESREAYEASLSRTA